MALSGSETPAFDSEDLRELKQKAVDGCHILDHEGITDGFGHVSLRVPGAEAFITIAAVSPGCATLERLVMLDFDGRYLGGQNAPPYEWAIHACIFKARPDVMSICHTHSKWSSLFSVLRGGLPPIHVCEVSASPRPADLSGSRAYQYGRARRSAGEDPAGQRGGFAPRPRRCRGGSQPRASDLTHASTSFCGRAGTHGRRSWRAALSAPRRVGDLRRRPFLSRATMGILSESHPRATLCLTLLIATHRFAEQIDGSRHQGVLWLAIAKTCRKSTLQN
jgi:hypothetical protein